MEWRRRGGISWKGGSRRTGLIHGDFSQFWLQLGGATLLAAYSSRPRTSFFKGVNAWRSMRVSQEVEFTGLDVPEFGMLAYPEDAVEMLTADRRRAAARSLRTGERERTKRRIKFLRTMPQLHRSD